MLLLFTTVVLAQTVPGPSVQAAIIDISADDAIYEDVSRQFAQSLADALTREGVSSVRIDESELPPGGCKLGPCLGVLARSKGALAVVTLDAEELSEGRSKVVVTLMRATNGEPLAGGRYELKTGMKKAPQGLLVFLASTKKAISKILAQPQ